MLGRAAPASAAMASGGDVGEHCGGSSLPLRAPWHGGTAGRMRRPRRPHHTPALGPPAAAGTGGSPPAHLCNGERECLGGELLHECCKAAQRCCPDGAGPKRGHLADLRPPIAASGPANQPPRRLTYLGVEGHVEAGPVTSHERPGLVRSNSQARHRLHHSEQAGRQLLAGLQLRNHKDVVTL